MRITLITEPGRYIAATDQDVEPGETVEVPDEVGASLCEQVDVWADATPVSKPKAKPAADNPQEQ